MTGEFRMPKHRCRPDGRGVVTIRGRDVYTGVHGTPEAERKFRRAVAEALVDEAPAPEGFGVTVGRLRAAYLEYVATRHVKRGGPTTMPRKVEWATREVAELYGDEPAARFSPRCLRAVRHLWTAPGAGGTPSRLARGTANAACRIVCAMFRWGVERELVPEATWRALTAVRALDARDGGRGAGVVTAAAPGDVDATLGHLGAVPAAIVRLMMATGMRPSEACSVRGGDLDMAGEAWTYRVPDDWNKMSWKRQRRVVYLGPRAQAALRPWLDDDPGRYCFRPGRRGYRRRGDNAPYAASCLAHRIASAAKRAGVPHWTAYQLRHLALTRIYHAMGRDAARATGGHSDIRTTLGYIDEDVATAEDRDAARRAALELG